MVRVKQTCTHTHVRIACTHDHRTHMHARTHACNAIRRTIVALVIVALVIVALVIVALVIVALVAVWHFLARIPFLHFTGTAPAFTCIFVNVWTLRPGRIVHHAQTCTCVDSSRTRALLLSALVLTCDS
jgi:hypothetical protein